MAFVGIFLIIFGLVDVIGSFTGFDLWRSAIGWRDMPDLLWQFSGYAEIGIGYFLLGAGEDDEENEEYEEYAESDEDDDDDDDDDDEQA